MVGLKDERHALPRHWGCPRIGVDTSPGRKVVATKVSAETLSALAPRAMNKTPMRWPPQSSLSLVITERPRQGCSLLECLTGDKFSVGDWGSPVVPARFGSERPSVRIRGPRPSLRPLLGIRKVSREKDSRLCTSPIETVGRVSRGPSSGGWEDVVQ